MRRINRLEEPNNTDESPISTYRTTRLSEQNTSKEESAPLPRRRVLRDQASNDQQTPKNLGEINRIIEETDKMIRGKKTELREMDRLIEQTNKQLQDNDKQSREIDKNEIRMLKVIENNLNERIKNLELSQKDSLETIETLRSEKERMQIEAQKSHEKMMKILDEREIRERESYEDYKKVLKEKDKEINELKSEISELFDHSQQQSNEIFDKLKVYEKNLSKVNAERNELEDRLKITQRNYKDDKYNYEKGMENLKKQIEQLKEENLRLRENEDLEECLIKLDSQKTMYDEEIKDLNDYINNQQKISKDNETALINDFKQTLYEKDKELEKQILLKEKIYTEIDKINDKFSRYEKRNTEEIDKLNSQKTVYELEIKDLKDYIKKQEKEFEKQILEAEKTGEIEYKKIDKQESFFSEDEEEIINGAKLLLQTDEREFAKVTLKAYKDLKEKEKIIKELSNNNISEALLKHDFKPTTGVLITNLTKVHSNDEVFYGNFIDTTSEESKNKKLIYASSVTNVKRMYDYLKEIKYLWIYDSREIDLIKLHGLNKSKISDEGTEFHYALVLTLNSGTKPFNDYANKYELKDEIFKFVGKILGAYIKTGLIQPSISNGNILVKETNTLVFKNPELIETDNPFPIVSKFLDQFPGYYTEEEFNELKEFLGE